MKLQKIVVENFRQFYGRQEIVFASAKGKNITVIHAENGFGKTALLNAVLWGFYGARLLSADLEKKTHVLTDTLREQSKTPEDDVARVQISFEQEVDDGDERYTLTRTLSLAQERSDPAKTTLELDRQLTDGQTLNVSNNEAQKLIDALLPEPIAPLLFFDGEGIDHLAMESNADMVKQAIHQMLGLKLLASAVTDLKHQNVRGALQKELRDNTDSETQKLIDRREKAQGECSEEELRLKTAKDNETACAAEIVAISADLTANQHARELQEKRTQLEAEQARLTTQLQEITRRLATVVADEGYALVADDLLSRVKTITDRMRAAGEMPAKVLDSFIQDLLRTAKCICGCELKEGTTHYAAVRNLLTKAADQHFNQAVEKLDNAVGVVGAAIPRARTNIGNLTRDRAATRSRLAEIKEELAEIHTKLDGKADARVHELESKRTDLLDRQRQHHGDQRVHQRAVEQLKQQIEALDREILEQKQMEETAAKAQRRLTLVDETTALLEEMLSSETEDLRKELGGEIRKHFDRIKIKPDHWLELTPEFKLHLKKNVAPKVPSVVAPSKGERQVMALVFIASLVALAKRRGDIPTVLKGLEGAEYPVIMDSPFGAFGGDFRTGVAKWVPQLAPQVVVLVSSTQYRGEVEHAFNESGRVGKRYLLVYHAPTKKEEASESITIGGKRFKQYFVNEVEHTEIKPIDV